MKKKKNNYSHLSRFLDVHVTHGIPLDFKKQDPEDRKRGRICIKTWNGDLEGYEYRDMGFNIQWHTNHPRRLRRKVQTRTGKDFMNPYAILQYRSFYLDREEKNFFEAFHRWYQGGAPVCHICGRKSQEENGANCS